MKESRIIGSNINLSMKKRGFSQKQMADKLGMSEEDILRIISGRLLLTGSEIKKIAEVIGVDAVQLVEKRNDEDYKDLIHCMGKFHKIDNADIILDYIDTYITLAEDCN